MEPIKIQSSPAPHSPKSPLLSSNVSRRTSSSSSHSTQPSSSSSVSSFQSTRASVSEKEQQSKNYKRTDEQALRVSKPRVIDAANRLKSTQPRGDAKSRRTSKTIAIAVCGLTGAGKSSFISQITDGQAKVGHKLKSCTSTIQEIPIKVDNQDVVLVDTPGFDDSNESDTEILSRIAAWMQTSFEDEMFLSGIIYLHRITDNRYTGSSIKNLKMFRKLCGDDNLSSVILATTHWDVVENSLGNARETELSAPGGPWASMIARGSSIMRHTNTNESALAVIRGIMKRSPIVLKIQSEMSVENKSLMETDAGESINEELLRMQKKHQEELELLKEETDLAIRQSNKALEEQLKADHATVVRKLHQNQESQKRLLETRAAELKAEMERQARTAVKEREIHQKELARKEEAMQREMAKRDKENARVREKLEKDMKEQSKTAAKDKENLRMMVLRMEREGHAAVATIQSKFERRLQSTRSELESTKAAAERAQVESAGLRQELQIRPQVEVQTYAGKSGTGCANELLYTHCSHCRTDITVQRWKLENGLDWTKLYCPDCLPYF
ncbi:hypothetical protein M501DRAFT_929658 [Patellaria atrata CBS 101060]|uniref:G domain-containing protein n=1 Tax=Patellaria atrata CBS 101060 TaxID=1346257 RepID=A0A9P4VV48_9PEZI|nr:hypothetical protein M501DRAFT_929658 [Patellaria atrata CBS 101060]